MKPTELNAIALLKELTDIGIALSTEKDNVRLLEMILMKAKKLTNADGATLYVSTEDNQQLKFEIMITESLGIHHGGTSGSVINIPPLFLYDENGNPNDHMVATWVANNRKTMNIHDVYEEKKFDFSGTCQFDKNNGYHSQSFLTVPMTNHLNEVIGVLQLINACDKNTNNVVYFSTDDEQVVESLASQAAVSITNHSLIEAQKELFDSLIKLIANSIDEKSPYTGGHCRRVPIITKMLVEAACKVDKGPLKEFTLTDDEKYEVEVAAWLHDCGKITTPEYVIDKATKLETIYDRVNVVDMRFEVLKRDAVIESISRKLNVLSKAKVDVYDDEELKKTLNNYDEDRDFIRKSNIGVETTSDEALKRIKEIANRSWNLAEGDKKTFLTDEEVDNLSIFKGTLTVREREIINHHAVVTGQMLASLPYPKKLKRVPQFAACHHERMDGKGYPYGIVMKEMPIQSRIIAIADVFEALTASDRPYKKAMPLLRCLQILGQMKLDGHIDPDLFDVFMHEKVYLAYAKESLSAKSIDEIDLSLIPGYSPLV